MANITNGQYVNITAGEVRITAFAQNAAGKVSIFSVPFSTPTGGISVSLDTILGRNREIKDIYNKPGNFAGSTTGNEVLVDKNGSMTLKDDFVYLNSGDSLAIERTKSLMRSLAMGDIFTSNATPYKVVGTNGTVKNGLSATGNKAFGLLTQLDGRLVVPQASVIDSATSTINTITASNTRVTAYNKSSLCVMFEVITKFDEVKSEGYRFVYTLNSNFKYQEADDANEVSFDQMMLSDVRYINKFFYDDLSAGEAGLAVPAREVRVGSSTVNMFKSAIGTITPGDVGVIPSAAVTAPTNLIKITNGVFSIEAYTPADGDICIGTKTIATKKYYFILKYDETGAVWEFVTNNVSNTTEVLTTMGVGVAAEAAIATAAGYSRYDFSFEAEDFEQI